MKKYIITVYVIVYMICNRRKSEKPLFVCMCVCVCVLGEAASCCRRRCRAEEDGQSGGDIPREDFVCGMQRRAQRPQSHRLCHRLLRAHVLQRVHPAEN